MLLELIRRLALQGTELARAYVGTLKPQGVAARGAIKQEVFDANSMGER